MKPMTIIKYVFTGVGSGLLIAAFFFYQSTENFIQGALTADGVVTELIRSKSDNSTTYKPVVEFTTQNGTVVEITSSASSNPPMYTRGEAVEVFYHADSPQNGVINGFFSLWGLALIFGGIGSVFFLVGIIIIGFGLRRAAAIEYLKRKGTPVYADFESVGRNGSIRMNGRNPYQIFAQWKNPRTHEIHIFKSENLWFDPESHIDRDQIMVLIDQHAPEKYYMDVSFLPQLAD